MTEERKIALDGFITLEGPFLEKLWAALLIARYQKVSERYETGGYHHDALTHDPNESTLYECTGQQRMTQAKIDRLAHDAFLIREEIKKEGEPPLKKVVLVSMLNRDSWSAETKRAFDVSMRDLREKGLTFERLDDYDVLLPLIEEGVLGFSLIENKLYPVGPEENGIRYSKKEVKFVSGVGLKDEQLLSFKRLPQSFLPSQYWATYYRKLLEESIDVTELPLVFLNLSFNFGIKWKSASDMKDLYKQIPYIKRHGDTKDFGDEAFGQTQWSRKNMWDSMYVFDASPILNRDRVSELLGLMQRAIRSYRNGTEYAKERIGGHLVASSEDFSPRAWWEARKTARDDIFISEIVRGTELLIRLLNEGILGFAFTGQDNLHDTANQVKLIGSGMKAIRLTSGKIKLEA